MHSVRFLNELRVVMLVIVPGVDLAGYAPRRRDCRGGRRGRHGRHVSTLSLYGTCSCLLVFAHEGRIEVSICDSSELKQYIYIHE